MRPDVRSKSDEIWRRSGAKKGRIYGPKRGGYPCFPHNYIRMMQLDRFFVRFLRVFGVYFAHFFDVLMHLDLPIYGLAAGLRATEICALRRVAAGFHYARVGNNCTQC